MKRTLAIALSLLLAFALTACSGTQAPAEAPMDAQEEITETPAPETPAPTEPPAETPEETPEPTPEETPEETDEEEEVVYYYLEDEENNAFGIQLDPDDETNFLVKFTLPSESPIYDRMKINTEGMVYAMMTHAVMEGVSGRTILEFIMGSCEDYWQHAQDFWITTDEIEPVTKDLNGRKVLVYMQEEQVDLDYGDSIEYKKDICDVVCVVAVQVNEDIVLGFTIDASYGVGSKLVFDMDTVDLLLSHCEFGE